MKKSLLITLTFLVFINIVLSMTLINNSVFARDMEYLLEDKNTYDLFSNDISYLRVKNESITLNITNEKKIIYENVADYKNNVQIDYSFYNDTNETIKTTFYQCIKKPSNILFKSFDGNKSVNLDDIELYDLPDGRFRYVGNYNNNKKYYEAVNGIRNFYDTANFVNNDSTVYQYTFKVNSLELCPKKVSYICLPTGQSDEFQKFFGYDKVTYTASDYLFFDFQVAENYTFTVNYLTDLSDSFLTDCKIYSESGTKIDGSITILNKEEKKFKDFVFYYYDESKGVSKMDYNNAVYDKINGKERIDNGLSFFDVYDSLKRFYEFEVSVEPNSTYDLSIKIPIYPSNIDMGTSYIFTYKFNYDSTVFIKGIESIYIKVNTDDYIIDCSYNKLKRNEIYNVNLDYDSKYVSFVTCDEKNPIGYDSEYNRQDSIDNIFYTIFLVIDFYLAMVIITGMIVALVAICANGRRTFNNLPNEIKKLKTIYIVEGIFELLLTIECAFQAIIPSIYIIQIIISIVILSIILIELIKYKQKHTIKCVLAFIILANSLLTILLPKSISFTLILVLLLFFADLFSIDKYKKEYCDKNEMNTNV